MSFSPGQPDIVIIIFKGLSLKVNGEKKSLKEIDMYDQNPFPI